MHVYNHVHFQKDSDECSITMSRGICLSSFGGMIILQSLQSLSNSLYHCIYVYVFVYIYLYTVNTTGTWRTAQMSSGIMLGFFAYMDTNIQQAYSGARKISK